MRLFLLFIVLFLSSCSIGTIRHKEIGQAECYKRSDGYSCDVDMFRLMEVLTKVERCERKINLAREKSD